VKKGDTGKHGGKRTQATATPANPNKAAQPAHNPTPNGDEHQKQKAEQHKTRNATPNSKRREKKQNKKRTQKEKQKKANQPPINIGEARWARLPSAVAKKKIDRQNASLHWLPYISSSVPPDGLVDDLLLSYVREILTR
jgi:hypothetical protein